MTTQRNVAVIGAGPSGLFAAERLASAGCRVTIYERMPAPARKFLLAGRGGLNLTHGEPLENFLVRYGDGDGADRVRTAIRAFPPEKLIAWANGLGAETFVGSSGRVFPKLMKASPLLRAWLRRLDSLGVSLVTRQTWIGFDESARPSVSLGFRDAMGAESIVTPDAAILALGGASWPKLGSDGAWVSPLRAAGVDIEPLAPSNCGVTVAWTDAFARRFAGLPLKRVAVRVGDVVHRGELMITETGLEGGVAYALGPAIRAAPKIGRASLVIDFRPGIDAATLAVRLSRYRRGQSTSTFLRKALRLDPQSIGLLREQELPTDAASLAHRIKNVGISVTGFAGFDRAISTAGGVAATALDQTGMLRACPGVFVAGEMLDWDAPTGGYLLQACFATAHAAADGALAWLDGRPTA
ncbi:MAG: NAD(P)/FAD-dependent oxidoreductase [Hyphomicrobium sp.]